MKYRSKSAPRALAEIEHLAAAHPDCDIQVVDNILDLRYFKTLLPELAKRRLNVSLFYETKSNLKKEQVRLLRDAGVTMIQPGIESFSDAVLKQMRKGVTGLQNIQLLKWCKEIGVQPIWNFLLGFPDESALDYEHMAALAAQVCHLPRPAGVTAIRLDRFSPNFTDADRLGFVRVRPLPFYAFIYDLPETARRNLAYFFAYDYKRPREIARYAEPLVRRVQAWRTAWRHAELVSVAVDDRLWLFDTRPLPVRSRPAVSKLTGVERDAYLACDAVTDAGQLPADHAAALGSLVARRLMLADGARHLSLAVPIGDYRPPVAAAARLRPQIAQVDAADRRAVTRAFRAG
jgi:ribosomal peptide maturation radical SAM protein 1